MTDADVIRLSTAESLTNDADPELDAYIEVADEWMQAQVALKIAKARAAATAERHAAAYLKYYGKPFIG